MQTILSIEQIEAFHHDHFVESQVNHFLAICSEADIMKNVIDMGGGCGFFAKRLMSQSDYMVRVVDMDEASVAVCHESGIEAVLGDALNIVVTGNEEIVTFNLILHHLVGKTEKATLELQTKALAVWRPHIRSVFVHEYIYESYMANFSGWLIYQITKNQVLSWFGRVVSTIVPSLKANTFGVGVRFRASDEWLRIFESAGYDVEANMTGKEEGVSLPRRLMLIKKIRRDSFLLRPRSAQ